MWEDKEWKTRKPHVWVFVWFLFLVIPLLSTQFTRFSVSLVSHAWLQFGSSWLPPALLGHKWMADWSTSIYPRSCIRSYQPRCAIYYYYSLLVHEYFTLLQSSIFRMLCLAFMHDCSLSSSLLVVTDIPPRIQTNTQTFCSDSGSSS